MELNTTTLRGILAAILSIDENHVVPKQGNWWNPQQTNANIENWCAFQIRSNKPRTAPFYNTGKEENTKVNGAAILKIATIDLQFVGPQSEDLAQNVALWAMRSDVQKQFKQVRGAVLYDGAEAISSIFSQEGNNTVIAWNSTLQVLWYSVLDTSQDQMPALIFNGKIINK